LGDSNTWFQQTSDGRIIGRVQADEELYIDALQKVKINPTKFLVTSIIQLFRLNSPMYPRRDGDIMPLLMGQPQISNWIKIVILVGIRLIWFSFLGLMIYGLFIGVRAHRIFAGLLILFVLYANMIHAVFSHGEVRYLFTAMPIYFLFFSIGLHSLINRGIIKKSNI
jgi:hypothetical protein